MGFELFESVRWNLLKRRIVCTVVVLMLLVSLAISFSG